MCRRRAFSLVELLVVLGVIAVLIGILLPVLASARRSANRAACLANLKQIDAGLQMYASQWGGHVFPPRSRFWVSWWTVTPGLEAAYMTGTWGEDDYPRRDPLRVKPGGAGDDVHTQRPPDRAGRPPPRRKSFWRGRR